MTDKKEFNFEELSPEMQEEYRSDLEAQAKTLGVTYRPNISTPNLYARINAARKGEQLPEEEEVDTKTEGLSKKDVKAPINLVDPANIQLSPAVKAAKQREYLNTKVRVQITCNDPMKQSWQGEFFEVSNKLVGEKREFIPFNVPWHVNRFILNMLEEKTYTHHYRIKDATGKEVNRHKLAKAFNVTPLPALTEREREAILNRQLATKDEQEIY